MEGIISVAKALGWPIVIFLGGVLIMIVVSGHNYVTKQLRERATPDNRKPLNMRFRGYNTAAVDRHWGVLDARALRIEQHFLQLDLLFPLFYGTALAIALLRTSEVSGRSLSPIWLIAPVAVTMLADWIENLVQLAQLRRYTLSGATGLEDRWIQVASLATIVKLVFFTLTVVLLIWLALGVTG